MVSLLPTWDPNEWLIRQFTGDVQPYIALGKRLIMDGHRIRIAPHESFRSFLTEHGLESFDIVGNL